MDSDNPLDLPRMAPEAPTAHGVNISNLPRPAVRLAGVNGNVFAILGAATKALKKGGWTAPQCAAFFTEATSGDYDHALRTCMKYLKVEGVE